MLSSERRYATEVLPGAVARGVADGLHARRAPGGLARATAVAAGLGITTAGYARGRIALRQVERLQA